MKKYALLQDDVVVQIQPYAEAGFEAVGANVAIGMVRNSLGNYEKPSQILSYSDGVTRISDLYNQAILYLQNGYSDEEVKTFPAKQLASDQYLTEPKSVANLSASSRLMMESITGSTDDNVISEKLERIVSASSAFSQLAGQIEFLRDSHIDQLVDGQDNSDVVESLKLAYAQIESS